MKKYFMMLGVLALVSCTNSKTKEELAIDAANKESMIRQRIIDSIAIVNLEANQQSVKSNSENNNNTVVVSEEHAKKKRMSNKTKGALIGTGAGIVAGAVTGAAVSKDKGKGAVVGGIIGGAVGSGVGYGAGANKDNKEVPK